MLANVQVQEEQLSGQLSLTFAFAKYTEGKKPGRKLVYSLSSRLLFPGFLGSVVHSFRRHFMKLINIGFGNSISAEKVVAIVSPESAPIKRIISDARDRGQLVDATYGRRTRAVMVTDSGHILLSAIQPETVAHRFIA